MKLKALTYLIISVSAAVSKNISQNEFVNYHTLLNRMFGTTNASSSAEFGPPPGVHDGLLPRLTPLYRAPRFI